jgi:DNA-binding FrmR family transcriptional regulator
MTEQELLKLKKDVESAKTSVSELTGQKNAIEKQLKDEWQCKDITEAETMLKQMQDDIVKIDQKIEQKSKEIETKYQL